MYFIMKDLTVNAINYFKWKFIVSPWRRKHKLMFTGFREGIKRFSHRLLWDQRSLPPSKEYVTSASRFRGRCLVLCSRLGLCRYTTCWATVSCYWYLVHVFPQFTVSEWDLNPNPNAMHHGWSAWFIRPTWKFGKDFKVVLLQNTNSFRVGSLLLNCASPSAA